MRSGFPRNALKYGALQDPHGEIKVKWKTDGDRARIEWRETLGTRLNPQISVGFGSTLITKLLFHPPDTAAIEYRESGITCQLDVTAEL
jgi:two-component sensor histidine kinase